MNNLIRQTKDFWLCTLVGTAIVTIASNIFLLTATEYIIDFDSSKTLISILGFIIFLKLLFNIIITATINNMKSENNLNISTPLNYEDFKYLSNEKSKIISILLLFGIGLLLGNSPFYLYMYSLITLAIVTPNDVKKIHELIFLKTVTDIKSNSHYIKNNTLSDSINLVGDLYNLSKTKAIVIDDIETLTLPNTQVHINHIYDHNFDKNILIENQAKVKLMFNLFALCNNKNSSIDKSIITKAREFNIFEKEILKEVEPIEFKEHSNFINTIYKIGDNQYISIIQGDVENILSNCTKIINNYDIENLDKEQLSICIINQGKINGQGMVSKGIAYKYFSDYNKNSNYENDLIFVGMVGTEYYFSEYDLECIKNEIKELESIGIQSIISTNLSHLTNKSICEKLGVSSEIDKTILYSSVKNISNKSICLGNFNLSNFKDITFIFKTLKKLDKLTISMYGINDFIFIVLLLNLVYFIL